MSSELFELVLRAPQALVEPVSDALMEALGALSVSVEDADAGNESERALFGEPGMPAPASGWDRSSIKALFETEQAATEAATLLLAQDWTEGLHVQGLAQMPAQDWVRLTQQQFTPVAITPSFWIVPSWHEVPAQALQVLRLDPGLAFGTGTHPTTRMCLRWLALQAGEQTTVKAGGQDSEQVNEQDSDRNSHDPRADLTRVLDYGCGSGILAIAAGLLGAGEVVAVDIDPAAVQATRDNAAHNGVQLLAGLPDRAAAVGKDGPGAAGYTVVLANILATPLKLLAPLLTAQLRPGGCLVLAGILQRQAAELQAAYAPYLQLQVADEEDGWILMTGQLDANRQTASKAPGPDPTAA